ncbi:Protein kinase domain [Dillenia turbinata]|uniref:Protein kinase domain n=1 Tax=Dillenia turbinata TaxID=194707 RepID=A0AAN8VNY2_9MAGN
MRGKVNFFSALLFSAFLFNLVCSQLSSSQSKTMMSLAQLLQNNTSWNTSTDPCSWEGVTCSNSSNNIHNSVVTQLSLSGKGISTSNIFPFVCEIDSLVSLNLSNNRLTSIPDEFVTGCGKISGLKLVNFSLNQLAGSFPVFTGFGALESLDVSFNKFQGIIDLQLDELVALKYLNLGVNDFTGSIPTHLGKSLFLEHLVLSYNHLNGTIPSDIANYVNLTLVDLSSNKLSGPLPKRIGDFSKLQILILSNNDLNGEIPVELATIQSLLRFAANQNNFTGAIPFGITKYLGNLDLSYNNLNGSISSDLLLQSNLLSVDLSYNNLQGTMPPNTGPRLTRLRLSGNKLVGNISSAICSDSKSSELVYLELDGNNLSGSIPPELGLCRNLALLNLAQNNLSGNLPWQLGNLSNLQQMKLQLNNFGGDIPDEFSKLVALSVLNLSRNSLSGTIPSWIPNMKNLTNLNLYGNELSGQIPNLMGSLSSLLELDLGSNKLSGNIPHMPVTLQISLNLSSNLFQGSIPDSLSSLTALEVLDLSNNGFSGNIPDFFTSMTGLTLLVLSNNNLSGFVPRFPSYIQVDFQGNDDLINSTAIPPTATTSKKKKSVSVVLVVVAVVVAVLAASVVGIISLLLSKRFYRVNDVQIQLGEEQPRPHFVDGNIIAANGIHRSNIDFNKAMEEVSDPLKITLKTRFSTYYEALMPSGTSYFIKKLSLSDKIFQLGSHEKFGRDIESLGKLNNSNIMIPLAYMLTADSAYLFNEYAEKGTLFDVLHGSLGYGLDWASRYSIAIGVAQGLAFLHGCASGPILLLDLSSRSIFLKSLREPQIGDVELYKLIDPSKSTGSFSTVAGSVGYVPPEYAYAMRVTMAGNVYSFGVILLELVTGNPAVHEGTELAKLVLRNSLQQDKWDHLLDHTISKTSVAVHNQMLAVLKIAVSCVSVSPEARPKMKSVLRLLLNAKLCQENSYYKF